MISVIHRLKSAVLITIFMIVSSNAQQILDEMQLNDISDQPSIKSSVIRDPNQALIIVKTQISVLRVESNNIIIKSEQVEPGTWHIRLAPGTHRLSFQAEGFISVQQRFYFNPKDVKGVQIRVIPAAETKEEKNSGIIVIKSTPDSAAVYLNDQFYGITPYLGKTLAGQYKLELKKEPFRPHIQQIIIIPGETLPVNVDLSADLGSVEILSNPPNARIEIDNQYIGETPFTYNKLSKGKHTIQVSLENYITFDSDFEINKNNLNQNFNITLKPKESILSVQGSPRNAQIELDEKKVGILPLQNFTLAYGAYHLTVNQSGFYQYQKDIVIASSDPLNLNITLKPKSKYSALLYSTLLPGSGQIYSGRTTPGVILGAASLGCATVALLFTSDYNDKNDNYVETKAIYDNNTDLGKMDELYKATQESYSEMEDAHQRAQTMWGITIAVWLYNMADALYFFPDISGAYLKAETQASYSRLVLTIQL